MSLTEHNVIPIQWLQFAVICTIAHLVSITPSLLTRKNLALQPKFPAQRCWSSLLVNQWRLDFHDQGQNLQMRAISQKVPTDQNTRNLIRERPEHVSQVTAALGLSSTCGELQLNLELACSRWWRCFYLAALAALGPLVTLASYDAFRPLLLTKTDWRTQCGKDNMLGGLVDRKQDWPY